MRVFIVCLAACFAACAGITVDKHPPKTPKADLRLLRKIYSLSNDLMDGVYEFFMTYGPDDELGGFYTEVDQFGVPNPEVPKNIVMQARALYVSSLLILEDHYPPQDRQRLIELMHGQFDFISQYLYAPHTKQFHYEVSPDGKTVINGDQRAYYTSFGIWGLTHYAMAALKLQETEKAQAAIQMALNAYQSMHDRLYDYEYGGYDQSRENNWFYFYGIEANRNKPEWGHGAKGYNTQMHILEALTSLYIASNDTFVGEMLEQLLDIHVNILLRNQPYQPIVTTRNWTSITPHEVDYGHGIELAHLMMDAGEALNYAGVSEEAINNRSLAIARNVQFYGVDRLNGGVFYSGLDKLGPTSYIKAFWVQVEASLGFWRAYLISGDKSFLQNMLDTLQFYERAQMSDLGEFYWEYNLYQPDTRGPNLYGVWKQAYHNSRCIMIIIDEIGAYLGK